MIEDFYESIVRKIPTFTKNTQFEGIPSSYTSSNINGYIGSRSDFEEMKAGKWTIRTQYKFYSDTNCNHGDIIVFGSENYRIIGDPQNTINKSHHFKTYVEKCENID